MPKGKSEISSRVFRMDAGGFVFSFCDTVAGPIRIWRIGNVVTHFADTQEVRTDHHLETLSLSDDL